jgi:hypothetical protein
MKEITNTMDMTDAYFTDFIRRRAKILRLKRPSNSEALLLLVEASHRLDAIIRMKRVPKRPGGIMRDGVRGTPEFRDSELVGTISRMAKRDSEPDATVRSLVVWARRLERNRGLTASFPPGQEPPDRA